MWLKAAGVDGVDATRGPRFNQSSLVLEAAIVGHGIALAKSTIAAADLAAGRVVKPFELTLPLDFAYYIVCPESKTRLPKVELFIQWLREEVAPAGAHRLSTGQTNGHRSKVNEGSSPKAPTGQQAARGTIGGAA